MAGSGSARSGGKRKSALADELNRALSAGLTGGVRMAVSRTVVESQRWTGADICEATHMYEATQDVMGAGDILSMRRGERVELLDDSDRSKKRRIRFEDTVEIVDVSDSYDTNGGVRLLGTASLLDCSAARHKAAIRPRQRRPPTTLAPSADAQDAQPIIETPHDDADEFEFPAANGTTHRDDDDRWLVRKASDPTQVGWTAPENLERQNGAGWATADDAQSMPDAKYRRDAVVRELVETEEEFGRDMIRVVERYMVPVDRASAPRVVRDNKDLVFSNLREIAEFHKTVLIEGIKYYADEPTMIGKTFLRLERDFDKHVAYCRDEPAAQEFLQKTPEARDYFEEISNQLGDDKTLSEHLKLPIQRINDYQLLLKELVRYSSRLCETTSDLSRALELMLAVPHKANDNKFISSIEGFQGNIHKLGRLLRHEWFTVSDREGRTKERYLFLFKARILICKVRRISEDRSVFVLKEIIRLPEVELKDIPDNRKSFELLLPNGTVKQITAHNDTVKDLWLKEIRLYAADFVALEEHAKDDLYVKPEEPDEEVSFAELPKQAEAPKAPEPAKVIETPAPPKEPERPIAQEEAKPDAGLKRKDEPTVQADESTKKAKLEGDEDNEEMSDYLSRRTSSSRRTGGRMEVEESYSVSRTRSSRQEVHSETSILGGTEISSRSSARSSSRIESSSEAYSSLEGRTGSRAIESSTEAYSSIGGRTTGGRSVESSLEQYSSAGGQASKSIEMASSSEGSAVREQLALTSSSSAAELAGRPVFSKTIEGTSLEPGETAVFECSVTGSEATRMLWLKDNKPLTDKLMDRVSKTGADNKFQLEIQNAHEEDSGIYTACATNQNGSSSCTASLEVQKLTDEERKRRREANAPMFLVKLRDTELLENTYLRFMVKVKGNPNPTVKFYKDERRILSTNSRVQIVDAESDNGYYELVIPDVTQEDAGCYSCVASNSYGEEKCEAQLSVTDSKDVFAGLTEETLEPGEQPHFQWTRNGQPFVPEDRFKVLLTEEGADGKKKKGKKDEEDSLALVFQHVKPDDAGLYTCVASTTSGKISCSAELTVKGGVNALNREPEKPKITVETKKQEVSVGGSAMLELKIEGCPRPEIEWTKNGEVVVAGGRIRFLYEDEDNMSLIIKGVTSEDAGTYTIAAWNELGEDTAEVELLVKSPPKFKTKMKDQSCMTDETLRLTVEVEGTPAPDLTWYKDGKEITETEERFRVVKESTETYTLIIEKVRLEDSGSYSIVARNEVSQTSEFYKVNVQSPPFFTQKMIPRKMETREGDFATFTVRVDGDPKPKVKWLKDGEELRNDELHIKIESDKDGVTHSLTIRGIKREDMGRYTCVLDNSHGSVSDNALMFVHCEPKFHKKLKDIISKEGQLNIVFDVTVHGFPKPDITWYHNEVEITERKTEYKKFEEGEVYLGETYSLTIKEVAVDQAGTYTCKAKNTMGENENSGNFKVLYVPKITKKLEDVSLDEGATLTLQIEANAVPIPDVTWYKDGREIKADANVKISRDKHREESYSMTLNLVKGKDTGDYECRVSNDQGTSSTKCHVQINKVIKTEEEEEEEIEKVVKVKKYEEEEEEKKEEEEKVQLKPEKVEKVEVDDDETKSKKVEEKDLSADNKPYKAFEIESGESFDKNVDVTKPKTPKIEDLADNQPKTYRGVTVEEVDDAYVVEVAPGRQSSIEEMRNKLQLGIVEEPAEPKFGDESRLYVHRGVSIVSVTSDDERRSVSPSPLEEKDIELELTPLAEKESSAEEQTLPKPKTALKLERQRSERAEPSAPSTPEVSEAQTEAKQARRLERKTSRLVSFDEEEPKTPEISEAEPKKALRLERASSKLVEDDAGTPKTPEVKDVSAEPKKSLRLQRQTSQVKRDEEFPEVAEVTEVKTPEANKALKLERRTSELISWDSEAPSSPVPEVTVQPSPKKGRLVQTASQEEVKVESRRESVSSVRSVEEPIPRRASRMNSRDEEELGDPAVEALLKRVERQRSRLEEILDKEDGRRSEAKPVIINHNMQDREIYESLTERYEVRCSAYPKPTVTWTKDNEEVTSNDYIKISEDGELYILEIKYTLIPRDEGTYKIKLENRLGEATAEATLSLIPVEKLRKPIIIEKLKNTECNRGEKGVLKAVITGDPVPDIKWWKDGKPILPDADPNVLLNCESRFIQDDLKECTYTLTIPKARHGDTGQYSLKATNKYGSAESNALLNIILRPEISNLKDQTGIPTELTQFEVVIIANPTPDVTWTKDDKPVVADDHFEMVEDRENEKYSLLIHDTATDDHGVYAVTARNKLGEATKSAQLSLHTEAPTFVKDLLDRVFKDSSPAEYKARANGVPKPKITWLKDGKEIVEGEDERITIETSIEGQVSSRLHITAVKKSDVGKYTCVASNLVGKAETSAMLNMDQAAPMVTIPLERALEFDEGEPMELKAKIDGSPVPISKWFKDGEEIKPDNGHIKLTQLPDGTVKLNIDEVKHNDGGAYKVVAINKNGEMESLCAVAVKPKNRKPSFTKPLEDVKIQAGEPLKLEALVTAFPIPEVKWFKDGHAVRPSQAINFVNDPVGHVGLIIEEARPEDAGQYTVKVANKLGAIEGNANVEVEEREKRPMFHTQLMPQKVVEGYPVRMEVKCVGHPRPTLTWTRNGEEIVPDGKKIKVVDLPDGTQALLIEKVGPEDGGEYAVTASNPKGSMTTSAPLTVQGKGRADEPEMEPAFVHPLRDAVTDEDGPLTMGALFVGNPIPDVAWSRDGVPITPNERVRLTCDGKRVGLEINPARLSDIGKYKCELSSPLGTAESEAEGNVRRIYTPASFVQKFTDLQQVPTLDAKFFARITGNPKPDVSWYYNGKPIQESKKYHMKQDGDHICLYVKDCEPKDSGTYMCKIANSVGKELCEADLEVVDKIEKKQKIEPPSFLKKIGDCEVLSGMSAKFTACINGFPEPAYEWFLNGKPLEPSNRISMEADSTGLLRLIIRDTQPGDVGIYRCRIFNPHGEASCEAELRYDSLDSKPKRPISDQYQDLNKHKSGVPLPLPYPPIISCMTDRQLTLSWRPSIPIGPRFPVTYQVEMCELPDGEWKSVRTGVRSCACEIHNLEPFRNYKFRIRVENKYGVSDPSPHCVTHREKLEPPPPRFFPYLEAGIDFRPETSPYFPKDFDIEKPPHDGYAQAPRFLRQEHDTQYGVKNHNCNLMWFVYGYPKPKMKYYFNDEEVEMGGRFSESYTRNGQATLFINKMLDRDVGWYEAVASNEHGEARQRVRLEIAEYPVFIKRPEETKVLLRKGCRLEARVAGVPFPDIRWFKDWKPLTSTVRCKISFVEPDTTHLHILDSINKDEGLYSVTAYNVAGSVSASAMVLVEEDERRYLDQTYTRPRIVRTHKEKPIGDAYDLGDELGRGTQGVTYHAVERNTGDNYAAKVMHGKGELRQFMNNELDIMSLLHHRRLIQIHDAFETPHSFTLITELAGGGELLDSLTRKPFYTEYEIAWYIRQLLEGLEHMHGQNIAHLGLTAGDLLLSHPGGDSLKICDFGLARRISSAIYEPLRYGMPEFVAPEVVNGDGVSTAADMWSVGILTYLLLSGRSLFRGENDRETLTRIREGKWEFDEELFSNYSAESRDFIKNLLIYQYGGRLNVEQALSHPWFNILSKKSYDGYKHSSDSLKNYYNSFKDWYNNASCRTWYRRRPLEGAFTHPSKMVYPPHERYTPERTPPREPYKSRNWEEEIHTAPHDVSYEIGVIKSESHYQNGPDTYLLQLRDVDFPVRLRKYMKVAANRAPGFSRVVADQNHLDWRAPVIRERRRFTDVMDEEIDDERKARINKYGGAGEPQTLRRLRHELGTRLDGHAEAEAMMQTKHEHEGQLPFFREKPSTIPIVSNEEVEISCFTVGDPKAVVQWYKCDMVIQETARVKFREDADGRSIMTLSPALNFDVGIYKVVARNKGGQTVARFRVVLAGVPSAPDSPEIADVSDNEVFLRWKQPKDDGNTAVLCYGLQYKEVDGDTWIDIAKNIDHEFFVVKNLEPVTRYYFRLAARNRIGWSDYGIPIKTKTKPIGVPKVQVTRAMQHLQQITESGTPVSEDTETHKLNYSTENNPLCWIPESDLSDKYHFISEISRGRYSAVVKGIEKATNKVVAGKLLELAPEREIAVNREFEALRTLRHERIASLIEAFRAPGADVAVLILEKLQGADILTYFSSRHEYNEQMVCTVISQILDGLQYLHWRGLCHLDLQPDNVVMASVRSVHVKLVDLGSAQTVSKLGTMVDRVGHIEYSSPEMLNDEPVFPQSDIWSLGVITYVLLSGVSPFRGENNEETRQNVLFVRYRFEHLFKELSQEATRFLMQIFKRAPSKRPTPEESHEHRWLLPTEFMIKKRERAVFLGIRLKEFCDEYHTLRARQAMSADSLVGAVDRRLTLTRSNSIVEELGSFQNGVA